MSGTGHPPSPSTRLRLASTIRALLDPSPLWIVAALAVAVPLPAAAQHSDEEELFGTPLPARANFEVGQPDAVAWSLRSPALFSPRAALSGPWPKAAAAYADGRFLEAVIALDAVPDARRTVDYWVYRTHLLLAFNSKAEAEASFQAARRVAPDSADVWALQAMMQLNQGDIPGAHASALRATAIAPDSPTALLARSYAHQAYRQPEAALVDARRMAEVDPNNALAHTRIAELELARGNPNAAHAAAERAAEIEPELAEVRAIRGFVHLAQDQTDTAAADFEATIRYNDTTPAGHLGLGLARIRQGRAEEGRDALAHAARLAPESALIHAYLGRAYLLAGNHEAAAQQFALARQADPQDPTPHAFEALRLIEVHQPVSARNELQEAMARFDNRRVYRTDTLISQDRALHLANAAAIDADLGLDEGARRLAAEAVAADPTSAAAHRALGDADASRPRAGIGRESEYLQSALRAPLGALPTPLPLAQGLDQSSVAPQRGAFRAQLPSNTGLNEYAAIFRPNGPQAAIDATLGDADTQGEQVRAAGSVGPLGWSLSQLNFQTNGFGPYEQMHKRSERATLAFEPTASTRLYAEHLSSRNDREGIFMPYDFVWLKTAQRVDEERRHDRIGLRQRLGPRDELLLYAAEGRIDQTMNQIDYGLAMGFDWIDRQSVDISTREAQYVHHREGLDLILGATREETEQDYVGPFGAFPTISYDARSLYGYARWRPTLALSLDLGLARDQLESPYSGTDEDRLDPKLGLSWRPWAGADLRLAAVRGLQRFAFSDVTLEPTQVAGFNQFHPDVSPGTRSEMTGLGWDQGLGGGLAWGLEASRREMELRPGGQRLSERDVRVHLDYAMDQERLRPWLPGWEATLTAALDAQAYDRDLGAGGNESISEYDPRHLRLAAALRHASGWGLDLALTRVEAEGTHLDLLGVAAPFEERFWTTDLAVQYQLPGGQGRVSLGALNLFDERHAYLEMDPTLPRFAPERYLYARVQLSF